MSRAASFGKDPCNPDDTGLEVELEDDGSATLAIGRSALARLSPDQVRELAGTLAPFLFRPDGGEPQYVATMQEAADLLFDADFYGAIWEWEDGGWLRVG